MSRSQLPWCAAAATASLALAAPAMGAPSLTSDLPCYTPGMRQHLTAGGLTPNGIVDLTLSIAQDPSTHLAGAFVADGTGGLAFWVDTPPFPFLTGDETIVAEDRTLKGQGAPAAAYSASIGLKLSQWDIDVKRWRATPAKAKPGRRTRVTAVGWVGTASTRLYAHYLRRGRLVKTATVGTLTGACGDFSGRMREFPFKRVKPGTYKVVFDTTASYPNDDSSIVYKRVKVARKHR